MFVGQRYLFRSGTLWLALTDSVEAVWPLITVRACMVHLIRGTFSYASRKDWDELSRDLRPGYTAPAQLPRQPWTAW